MDRRTLANELTAVRAERKASASKRCELCGREGKRWFEPIGDGRFICMNHHACDGRIWSQLMEAPS